MNNIENILNSNDWKIVETLSIQGRKGKNFPIEDLPVSDSSRKFLQSLAPHGIYSHQREAILAFLKGNNVCLATGTASGKSLAFQISAIEQLIKDPSAKVIAIYPMKALGREQAERWKKVLEKAEIPNAVVGIIDGNIPRNIRVKILERSQIIVFTPDVIHAWLLSNLADAAILRFLKKVSLIVVDEVHVYSGVFGSNSAFLFRRLQHIFHTLGSTVRYVCASATIAEPQQHLHNLFGLDFTLVAKESDSSPKYPFDIHFCLPPTRDLLTELSGLFEVIAKTSLRFIAFVDSRRQVELISSVLARSQKNSSISKSGDKQIGNNQNGAFEEFDTTDNNVVDKENEMTLLDRLDVLPYRAGYEEKDRNKIQQRLSQGRLSGVISTSALELGIDIPYLDMCILIGVPKSATSLQQRVGRIGRHAKGDVLVINTGDVYDQAIFAVPSSFLKRPLAESTLYLDNIYIQYIHALCLARLGGEHDIITNNEHADLEFSSFVSFPDNFINICNQERFGQLVKDLQSKKAEAGNNPNYSFPLRDVESQFKIEDKTSFRTDSLGSISYRQLMREAYPGAIYYYATQPYRVYHVSLKDKKIQVRKDKKYTTKPQMLPTLIFPNLTDENIFRGYRYDQLVCIECNLQATEAVNGFTERRGPTQLSFDYPLSHENGIFFDQNLFSRNFFTSGVLVHHPALDEEKVNSFLLAELIFEAFLLLIPFEKQDLDFASDRFRISVENLFSKGKRFIAIYDQTYGSLRLSGRFLDNRSVQSILKEARVLADQQGVLQINNETLIALDQMIISANQEREVLNFESGALKTADEYERIIMPDSKGLLARTHQDFWVKRIIYRPDGLRYEGQDASCKDETTLTYPLVKDVFEIPGESRIGLYNYNTGEVKEIFEPIKVQVKPVLLKPTTYHIDFEKLEYVINRIFDIGSIITICQRMNIGFLDLDGQTKGERVKALVSICELKEQGADLLTTVYTLARQQRN